MKELQARILTAFFFLMTAAVASGACILGYMISTSIQTPQTSGLNTLLVVGLIIALRDIIKTSATMLSATQLPDPLAQVMDGPHERTSPELADFAPYQCIWSWRFSYYLRQKGNQRALLPN